MNAERGKLALLVPRGAGIRLATAFGVDALAVSAARELTG